MSRVGKFDNDTDSDFDDSDDVIDGERLQVESDGQLNSALTMRGLCHKAARQILSVLPFRMWFDR